MPETIQPPEDELQQLENKIQEVKSTIGGVGDDEKARFRWFCQNFYDLERNFFWRPDRPDADPGREAEIVAKQQEMRAWLKEQGYEQMAIEPTRTSYDYDKHHVHGLIWDRDRTEGTVAEILSPGFEYKGKTTKKAVIKMYARPR